MITWPYYNSCRMLPTDQMARFLPYQPTYEVGDRGRKPGELTQSSTKVCSTAAGSLVALLI